MRRVSPAAPQGSDGGGADGEGEGIAVAAAAGERGGEEAAGPAVGAPARSLLSGWLQVSGAASKKRRADAGGEVGTAERRP
eukprot:2056164-Prymnesium_polylepis.1